MEIFRQGQFHIWVFPMEYGKDLFSQKGAGDGTGPDLQSPFLGKQKG